MEFNGGMYGQLTGEGPSGGIAPVHHVTIDDRRNGQVVEVEIPEDRCFVLAFGENLCFIRLPLPLVRS